MKTLLKITFSFVLVISLCASAHAESVKNASANSATQRAETFKYYNVPTPFSVPARIALAENGGGTIGAGPAAMCVHILEAM